MALRLTICRKCGRSIRVEEVETASVFYEECVWCQDAREEQEEEERDESNDYCPCLTGCEVCGGVSNHYWPKEEGT